MRKYIVEGIAAIDEIVDDQDFELRKIFDHLSTVFELSASLRTLDVDRFDAFDAEDVGEEIRRK